MALRRSSSIVGLNMEKTSASFSARRRLFRAPRSSDSLAALLLLLLLLVLEEWLLASRTA